MNDRATGTLRRDQKGPLASPPPLRGDLKTIADTVGSWPNVSASMHWSLDHTKPDGVDFYVAGEELGHLHLDGSIHLATSPSLGKELIAERVAMPFRYQKGWVEQQVNAVGPEAAIALFRRNYGALRG